MQNFYLAVGYLIKRFKQIHLIIKTGIFQGFMKQILINHLFLNYALYFKIISIYLQSLKEGRILSLRNGKS